ncbi:MAG: alpha-amylase family glycosyl hydrolase [Anaerolineae bacterium]
MDSNALWWKKGIVYQIYPRSFQDSNGDGVGDLPGITQRLDYLQTLGIDAIWLSPIYPSPMADFGYDVSDYIGIHPLFGTMADFDHLLAETHRRGLKLMLDLVPNHTSDEHPWFRASASSRSNPRRDWYIWRDAAPGGGPPNNWLSHFGGPAWTYDDRTGQYYLHQFLKEQPELNYRNPAVLEAMSNVMRFWLDKGVDGFRVDVIYLLAKDELFRDNPPNPTFQPGMPPFASLQSAFTSDLAQVHSYIQAMRKVMDEYDERVLVGEIYLPYDRLVTYYGVNLDECHLPFNFRLINTPWQVEQVRQTVEDYENLLPPGAWPNWVLGNHDQPRIATRVGRHQARVAQMLLLTLRGTPTCYYGDELALENVFVPRDRWQDPAGINQPDVADASRDPERTPMQWTPDLNAGFSAPEARLWLPIAHDYKVYNVEVESADSTSMLMLYRRITALRRALPALSLGSYRTAHAPSPMVFAYLREEDGMRLLVALNFGSALQTINWTALAPEGRVLLSTELDREGIEPLSEFKLRANEGVIVQV